VAIVTGAGRGLGREHALYLAAHGARVVVNDLGGTADGQGHDHGPADDVAAEIRALGGEAIADSSDVTDWAAGQRLIERTVDQFGDLHVLVNNAGILRDRFLVNMTEEEWDDVIRVHLKGHFVPLRHAAAYWRERSNAGEGVDASVINTSSTSGLHGNPGQANYGAAKAGIGALTVIAAQELGRYGVRVNGIAPAARTRLTEASPGLGEIVAAPEESGRFDEWDPANVSPLVGWLAQAGVAVTGRMFFVFGGTVQPMSGWSRDSGVTTEGRWGLDDLDERLRALLS
jgi:NAD(P)-dependent dehydrogenase (short-subunit alcohol dehydrogenase family)